MTSRDDKPLKPEALDLDHNLIHRVRRLTTGATVHRLSQALTIYMGNVELWNQFVARKPTHPGELEEKQILRDRALAVQMQLRQALCAEEIVAHSSKISNPNKS